MAVIRLHFSEFFKDKILSEEKKGSIASGKWEIPVGKELSLYIAPESFESNKKDGKIGATKIVNCKNMRIDWLINKETIICGDGRGRELVKVVKHWHKCGDSDVIILFNLNSENFKLKEILR